MSDFLKFTVGIRFEKSRMTLDSNETEIYERLAQLRRFVRKYHSFTMRN